MPKDQSSTLAKMERTLAALAVRWNRVRAEEIAHASDGSNQAAVSTELLPQVADVHIEGAIETRGAAAVEAGHELVSGNDATGRVHEELEDLRIRRWSGQAEILPRRLRAPRG